MLTRGEFGDDDDNDEADLHIKISKPLDCSSVVRTLLILKRQSLSTIGEDSTREGRSDTGVIGKKIFVVTTSHDIVDIAARTTANIPYV